MRRALVRSGLVLWSVLLVIAAAAWPMFPRPGVDATAGILVAALCSGWVGFVSETMQPRAVAVWVREESTPS